MSTVQKSKKRSLKSITALTLTIVMVLSCLPTVIADDVAEFEAYAEDVALEAVENSEEASADDEASLDSVTAASEEIAPMAAELQTVAAELADDDFLPNPQYPWQDHRLSADERVEDIMSRLTTDEKIYGTTTSTRLNLTGGQGSGGESLHGVATGGHSTVFPAPFGMSQTWNKDLLYKMGEATAKERLANGITAAGNWAPILDTIVDPRSGRAVERMGEDGYLIGSLGFEMAKGFNQRNEQGYQMGYGMLKHFMAYGPQVNRLWIPTVTTQRTLREYFVPSWYYTIAGGASKEYMNSYPVVNGRPMTVNPLQGESLRYWTPNFPGSGHNEHTTMNDYGSGSSVFVHSQRFLPDNVMGRALGMAMGIQNLQRSWSFRDYGGYTGNQYETVARGMATAEDFADYSRRVLTNRLRFGYLDQIQMQSEYLKDPIGRYGTARANGTGRANGESLISENRELTFKLSQEQIVMLKNDNNYLPLKGSATEEAVVLGPLADLILKNWYTGQYAYKITLKDALINKLGAGNVYFNNAVDSVAIKHDASGKYLQGGTSTAVSNSGAFTANSAIVTADADTRATGIDAEAPANRTIFEVYDYGSDYKLLRTAVNGLYVQVYGVNSQSQVNAQRIMYNNTFTPGVRSLSEVSGGGSYSNYQSMRLARTEAKAPGAEGLAGKYGIYHTLSGNGLNGGMALAYDVDDEDINRGSYLTVGMEENPAADDPFAAYKRATYQRVTPDIVGTNGPWMTEYGVVSPVDTAPNDGIIDSLPASHVFTLENIQSAEQAAKAQIDKVAPGAPIILVVGYEPHLNAREAFDLLETGLSEQQMRLIDYVTTDLNREVILVVKTNNPMAIDRRVQDNPNVKSILTIAHHGQEEGSALVSVLFDDGYTVPETGWVPADSGMYQIRNETPTSHQPYDAYPGYLPANRTIPAASPAGRLSATWYDGVEQMIGASEEHPPSSFIYPAFDEKTNNNLSSMNGTMPTGILTHDIINGERTYMYLGAGRNDAELESLGLGNKKTGGIQPLYAFGHGLSYGDFTYSNVSVSAITEGPTGTVNIEDTDGRGIGPIFTVSGTVTNNSAAKKSDEVVQIYATFDGPSSRIQHPLKKLIGYTRLKDVAPGATASFSITIDVVDKLGVFDVEIGETIVEPGTYTIKVGGSSDAALMAGNNATLTIAAGAFSWVNLTSTGIDGRSTPTAAAVRNLGKVTYAENFDDYSLRADGSPESIEPVATTIETDSGNSVKFRGEGTWIVFKNVDFPAVQNSLTVRVGADRTGSLGVYLTPAGTGIPDFNNASAASTFSLTDTRVGMDNPGATNLGIGQVGVPATATSRGYAVLPGDSVGRTYDDNYIKPDFKVMNNAVSVTPGRYDVYVRSEKFGTVLEWIKFGTAPDTAAEVVIDSIYRADYIREPNGTLQLRTKTDPISAIDAITWSVDDTAIATIDQNGLLTAVGGTNGEVVVSASAASGAVGEYTVYVTNQLESNKVDISTSGAPNLRSVDHLIMRNNNAFSVGDLISTYQGSQIIGLATSPFLSESGPTFTPPAASSQNGEHGPYIPPNNFLTIPQARATWTITNLDGTPTELATVSDAGVVRATGVDNGSVLVTATLIANPDISATKEIFIVGQAGSMDPYKMIHFGDYTSQTSITGKTATYSHTNRQTTDIGYYIANPTSGARGTLTFRSIGFTYGADTMYIRAASAAGGTIEVYCDGEHLYNITIPDNPDDTAVSGDAARPGNIRYRTFVVEDIEIPEGDHEIIFALTDGYLRLNWFQFEGNAAIDQENMDIRLVNSDPFSDDSFAPVISVTSKTAFTAYAVVAAYDADGKLIDSGFGEQINVAADVAQTLTASIPKNAKAVAYKVFVWTDEYKPVTIAMTF